MSGAATKLARDRVQQNGLVQRFDCPRSIASVHFHGLSDRASLVGELFERERQLPRIDAFRLLSKEALAEDIELVPQGRDLTLTS